MTRQEGKLDTFIRVLVKETGKSRGWVTRTIQRSGDYQKILLGQKSALYDKYMSRA
jgi:hypothetical protein